MITVVNYIYEITYPLGSLILDPLEAREHPEAIPATLPLRILCILQFVVRLHLSLLKPSEIVVHAPSLPIVKLLHVQQEIFLFRWIY